MSETRKRNAAYRIGGRRSTGRRLARLTACLLLGVTVAAAQTLLIRGGKLFDATSDQVRPNTGIAIANGRILAVDPDPTTTGLQSDRVIDLDDDRTVLPGFFNLHAHYNVELFGRERVEELEVQPVVYLANGVTSTFTCGEFDPEGVLAMRHRIERGKQIGPRILNSGPYFGTGRPGWNPRVTPEQIGREIDEWAARGVAGIKVKRITEPHLKAVIERAHAHGFTVTGHLESGIDGHVNSNTAIRLGIDRVEHFFGGDVLDPTKPAYEGVARLDATSPEVEKVLELFLRRRVYFDATLSLYALLGRHQGHWETWTDERRFFTDYVRSLPEPTVPKEIVGLFAKVYSVKLQTVKKFYDRGGGDLITLGTDFVSHGKYLAGFSTHREVQAMVFAGISPAAALKIATINGARALGMGDRLGTIEPGKLADLFVVRGNPLDDIRATRNVELVVKSGTVYDSAELLRSVEGKLGPNSAQEAEKW
jgi:imidazolonepropionase-like amidohydrolase